VTSNYNERMELGQDSRAGSRFVPGDDRGYAMAVLLVGLSVMAVMLTMAMPVWSQFTKREREAELIWRGQQYARAIGLFQRKFANTFPPNVDILVEQRFLRKKYKDPVTNDDFQLIAVAGGGPVGGIQPPGGGPQGAPPVRQPGGPPTGQLGASQPALGVQGVTSKSKDTSLRVYNGRTRYNEWLFVHLQTAQGIGPGGVQRPGGPPGSGRPGIGPGQQPGQGFGPGSQGGASFPLSNGQRPPLPPGTGFPQGGPRQPFGQPSPFTPPSPFGQQPRPNPPTRPPGI
jgi:type II secretory pathway pseudopilin PulG